jgi:hypothetical protein
MAAPPWPPLGQWLHVAVDNLSEAARAHQQALSALASARQRMIDARERADGTRRQLVEAIVSAARAGVMQKDIIRLSGYSREGVRRVLRAAGIEAD